MFYHSDVAAKPHKTEKQRQDRWREETRDEHMKARTWAGNCSEKGKKGGEKRETRSESDRMKDTRRGRRGVKAGGGRRNAGFLFLVSPALSLERQSKKCQRINQLFTRIH